MVKREVSILESAAKNIAEIAYYIESKGMPKTAKKFVDEAFEYFEKIANGIIVHKPCTYKNWKNLNYHCVPFKKKYTIAYLNFEEEIIICEFVSSRLLG